MSKRVLIILGAGFLLLIAGIMLLRYELSEPAENYETDEDLEEIPGETEKLTVIKGSMKQKKTTDETTASGSGDLGPETK